MTRQKQILDTMARLASIKEKQATVAMGRAEDAKQAAQAQADELDTVEVAGEQQIIGQGTLGTVERELLWAHRTWVRRERIATEERLALTAQEVGEAQARLDARKRDTRVRENVRDHVVSAEHAVTESKAQKELDELTSMRWGRDP